MLFEQMCASSHCKLISSILLFCYAKVRKLEEADALLEEQKHRSAEFCEAADAYIQELSAENLQLKAQFEESDIQALQNRCTISFFLTLQCIASKFDNRVLTYDNMVN
jgi:hypothetical protein